MKNSLEVMKLVDGQARPPPKDSANLSATLCCAEGYWEPVPAICELWDTENIMKPL